MAVEEYPNSGPEAHSWRGGRLRHVFKRRDSEPQRHPEDRFRFLKHLIASVGPTGGAAKPRVGRERSWK
jgi:hypothetical protein